MPLANLSQYGLQLVSFYGITISFLFYAAHRAAEVPNYFPFCLEDGSFPTPFELVKKFV
jgi:hypothetical protein